MSLATLKKKTASKYHSMSVGSKTGFSLNGGHRSQGYIGQTMLSRSLPRTLAKGATQRGHGGSNGKFVQQNPVISAVTSTEDPSIIKRSVLDNDGMIATKYRWIRRPAPFTNVKEDTTQNRNNQQQYIDHVHQKTVQEIQACGDNTKICNSTTATTCTKIMSKKQNSLLFNFTKPQCGPKFIPQDQSTYLNSIKCTEPYKQTSTANHPPFSCGFIPVNYCSNNTGGTVVGVNTALDGNPIGRMITTKNTPSTCKFPRSNR